MGVSSSERMKSIASRNTPKPVEDSWEPEVLMVSKRADRFALKTLKPGIANGRKGSAKPIRR